MPLAKPSTVSRAFSGKDALIREQEITIADQAAEILRLKSAAAARKALNRQAVKRK